MLKLLKDKRMRVSLVVLLLIAMLTQNSWTAIANIANSSRVFADDMEEVSAEDESSDSDDSDGASVESEDFDGGSEESYDEGSDESYDEGANESYDEEVIDDGGEVVVEEPAFEEPVIEEPTEEPVIEESISEDTVSEDSVSEDTVSEDSVSEDSVRDVYEYEDGEVHITVELTDAAQISDEAELAVSKISLNSSQKEDIEDAVEDAGLGELIATYAYDIHFVLEGEEIEPEEGSMKVTISPINKPILEKQAESVEDNEAALVHITDAGEIELSTSVEQSDKGGIEAAEITVEEFSAFVLVVAGKKKTGIPYSKSELISSFGKYGLDFGVFAYNYDQRQHSQITVAAKNAKLNGGTDFSSDHNTVSNSVTVKSVLKNGQNSVTFTLYGKDTSFKATKSVGVSGGVATATFYDVPNGEYYVEQMTFRNGVLFDTQTSGVQGVYGHASGADASYFENVVKGSGSMTASVNGGSARVVVGSDSGWNYYYKSSDAQNHKNEDTQSRIVRLGAEVFRGYGPNKHDLVKSQSLPDLDPSGPNNFDGYFNSTLPAAVKKLAEAGSSETVTVYDVKAGGAGNEVGSNKVETGGKDLTVVNFDMTGYSGTFTVPQQVAIDKGNGDVIDYNTGYNFTSKSINVIYNFYTKDAKGNIAPWNGTIKCHMAVGVFLLPAGTITGGASGGIFIGRNVENPNGEFHAASYYSPEHIEFNFDDSLARIFVKKELAGAKATPEDMKQVFPFRVKQLNGKVVYEGKIKIGETIKIDGLVDGWQYIVEEYDMPDGYQLKNIEGGGVVTAKSGAGNANDKAVTIIIKNEKTPLGSIKVKKVDSTDERADISAKFILYSCDAAGSYGSFKPIGGEFEVKNVWYVIKDLKPGNYALCESQADDKHVLPASDHKEIFITVDNTGKSTMTRNTFASGFVAASVVDNVASITVKNAPKFGSLKVKKVVTNDSSDNGTFFFKIKNNTKGTYVRNSNGSEIWSITAGETVTVENLDLEDTFSVIEVADANGTEISDNKKIGDITASNFGYDVAYVGNNVKPANDNIPTIQISNTKKTVKIKVHKVDSEDSGISLPGAVFELMRSTDGGKSWSKYSDQTYTTGNDGKIEISNLPWGTYMVHEIKAPEGYKMIDSYGTGLGNGPACDLGLINTPEGPVFIYENMGDGEIGNAPLRGQIKIQKVDENGVGLAGAQFKLSGSVAIGLTGSAGSYKFDKNGNTNLTLDTDASGNLVITELPLGTYTLTEITTPAGYELTSAQNVDITIVSEDETDVIKVENAKINGSLRFQKVDAEDTTKGLQGAVYSLYKKAADGTYVWQYDLTSDASGIVSKDTLPAGDYKVVEKTAPTGYEVDTKTEFTFAIVKNGDVAEIGVNGKVTDTRKKGKVTINKVDENNDLLDGAAFTLYTNKGQNIAEKALQLLGKDWFVVEGKADLTANGGVLTISDLEWGDYLLKETTVPEGYDGAVEKTFTISAEELEVNFTGTKAFVNNGIKGSVELVKIDGDAKSDAEKYMSGIEFILYNKADNSVYTNDNKDGKYVTNASGKIRVDNLPFGSYYFKEAAKVDGYAENTKAYDFTISKSNKAGETVNVESVSVTNTREKGSLKIHKVDGAGNDLSGAEFTLYKYYPEDNKSFLQVLGSLIGKDSAKVGSSTTNADGIAEFKDLEWGNYFFVETKAPNGYSITYKTENYVTIDAANVSKTETYTISNEESKGKIGFTKTDENGAVLDGATFQLYQVVSGAEDKAIGNVVSTTKGVYVFENLEWGTYYVKEVTAPTGYAYTGAKTDNVTINKESFKDGEPVLMQVSMKNVPVTGKVTLTKKFEGKQSVGNDLSGIEFTLYKKDGSKIDAYTTNVKGEIIVENLAYGDYYFQETNLPARFAALNYVKNANKWEFSIDGTDAECIKTVEAKNTDVNASAQITKVDKSGNTISDATFGVYNADGTLIEEKTTGKDGLIKVVDYGIGSYYFQEISNPGYVVVDTKYFFDITEDDNGKTVDVYTESGKLASGQVVNEEKFGRAKLVKVDKNNTNKSLEGAEFKLYQDGKEFGTYTTNGDGVIIADGLKVGSYYFQESKAPKGYLLSETKYEFEITRENLENKDADGVMIPVSAGTATDEEIKGKFELTKTDAADQNVVLAGAEFTLHVQEGVDKSANDPVYTGDYADGVYTTNKDGKITIENLPYGKYWIQETKEPVGYELNTETVISFTVDSVDGKNQPGTITKTVTNDRLLGSAVLIKSEEGNDSVTLSGAVFVLQKKNGTKWDDVQTYTTDRDGSISTGKVLEWGVYRFKETSAPDGYSIIGDGLSDEFEIGKINDTFVDTAELSLTNKKELGSVALIKLDQNKKPVAGAKFDLYSTNDNTTPVKKDLVTDKDGKIAPINDLEWGTYYFVETEAPTGYVMSDAEPELLTINKDNVIATAKTPLTATVTNTKIYGDVQLKKVDGTKTLAGAEFELYDAKTKSAVGTTKKNGGYAYAENGTVKTLVTDDKGIISVTGLPYGDYYFVETKAPAGYVKDINPVNFTVSENGKLIEVSKSNSEVKANIEFKKVDASSKELLAGATFTLTAADGTISTETSGSDGIVSFKGLQPGTYTVQETAVPDGYELSDKTYTVTITDDDDGKTLTLNNAESIVTVENERKTGGVVLTKTAADYAYKLAGATFALYKKGADGVADELISTEATDANGEISKDGLTWGDYYFVETNAPAGYELDTTHVEFTVNATTVSKTINVSKDDKEILGEVYAEKVDQNKELLSGAKFALYTKNENSAANTLTKVGGETWYLYEENIAADGGKLSKTGLEWNEYRLVETDVPEGYTGAIDKTFTIGAQNLKVEFTGDDAFVNDQITGSVELLKKDKTSDDPLTGVTFAIYKADGTEYKSGLKTNSEGKIVETGIPYGEYYFKETETVEGYTFNENEKYPFTIESPDAQTIKLSATNDRRFGEVSIVKIDATTNVVLDGAEFTLYKYYPESGRTAAEWFNNVILGRETKAIETKTTTNGTAKFEDLEWGDYVIIETKAPEGYEISYTPENFFTIGADSLVIPTITYKDEQAKGKIRLTKYNSATSATLDGATFQLKDAEGNVVRDLIATTNGVAVVEDLPWGEYYFEEISAPEGFAFDETNRPKSASVVIDQTKFDGATAIVQDVTMTNTPVVGKVTLTKKFSGAQSVGDDLSGIGFDLYQLNKDTQKYEKYGETVYTNAAGNLTVENLAYGSYYFKEVELPEKFTSKNYVISTEEYPFYINGTDALCEADVTVTNSDVNASASITKVDTNGNKIDKAVFGVYRVGDEKPMYTKESGEDGVISAKDLGIGSYYFQEISNPGFDVSDTKYFFDVEVADNGKEVSVYVKDGSSTKTVTEAVNTEKKGSAKLLKVDANNTTSGLDGAEFELYKKGETSARDTYTTENGAIVATGLEAGEYYFKETKAPKGYLLSDTEYPFTITRDDLEQTIPVNAGTATNEKVKGSILLTKTDSLTAEKLSGAQFTMYTMAGEKAASTDSVYGVYSVGREGTIEVKDIPAGKYWIQETKAPTGYELNEKIWTFEIEAEGLDKVQPQQIKVDVTDERKLGEATLTKKDAVKDVNGNDINLSGAVFDLEKLVDNKWTKVDSFTTLADGSLKAENLAWGTYRFVEKTAPVGYDIVGNGITETFEIGNTNQGFVGTASLTVTNEKQKGSVTLLKLDQENNPVGGAVFELYNTADTTKPVATVTTKADGTIDPITDLAWGTYYFLEKSAPVGYVKSDKKSDEITINKDNVAASIETPISTTVVNTKIYGNVQLKKVDGDKTLQGAHFALYLVDGENKTTVKTSSDSDGKYSYDEEGTVTDLITDANGLINVTGLPYGSYEFVETKAPATYVKDEKPIPFTVSESGQLIKREFSNSLVKAGVEFLKTDNTTGDALCGAEFTIYNEEGTAVTSATSDVETGLVSFSSLQVGKYTIRETKAPEGYEVIDTVYTVEITDEDDGKILNLNNSDEIVNVVNERLEGSVVLTKTAAGYAYKLAGATFELYKVGDTDEKIGEYTSNENGIVSANGLAWGEYYFKETAAPDGYEVSNEQPHFTISANNVAEAASVTMDDEEKVGSVSLNKIDAQNQLPLEGVEFTLYALGAAESDETFSYGGQTYNKVGKFTTDANGVISVENLTWDSYVMVETQALPGYIVPENNAYPFTIGLENETAVLSVDLGTIENEETLGTVELTKEELVKNELTHTAIEGAEFSLYKMVGDVVDRNVDTVVKSGLVTDVEGKITVDNLPWGSYYFYETQAPAGYAINEEKNPSEILVVAPDENGEVGTVYETVTNEKILGEVSLVKVTPVLDEDGNPTGEMKPLAGARFILASSEPVTDAQKIADSLIDGNYWIYGEYVTDSEGKIVVKDLPWADYYFVEIEAPEGYVISTNEDGSAIAYTFHIGPDEAFGQTLTYEFAEIVNYPEETEPPTPPKKHKKKKSSSSSDKHDETTPPGNGGGFISGVLGAIGAPQAGVLGERVAPITGDNMNLMFWLITMMSAAGVILIGLLLSLRKLNKK